LGLVSRNMHHEGHEEHEEVSFRTEVITALSLSSRRIREGRSFDFLSSETFVIFVVSKIRARLPVHPQGSLKNQILSV
jgi:hypothetical protein